MANSCGWLVYLVTPKRLTEALACLVSLGMYSMGYFDFPGMAGATG